jgi:hypothetical protein
VVNFHVFYFEQSYSLTVIKINQNQKIMIKILGIVLTVIGVICLIMGVIGAFGSMETGISPWALIILGVVLLPTGTSLLKHKKDTDEV